MDRDGAISYLIELQEFLDQSRSEYNFFGRNPSRAHPSSREIERRLMGARRIAARVAPELVDGFESTITSNEWAWEQTRLSTNKLVGLLSRQDELERILEPEGPKVAAANLHPWVWESAAALWDDGHRRAAVQTAASLLETHVREKLGRRDLGGQQLFAEAFKRDPARPGQARLRRPGFEPGTDDYNSAHVGAMLFGQGCMMAIRNLATHLPDELDEQVALEQLAALSVIARWVDEAVVTRA